MEPMKRKEHRPRPPAPSIVSTGIAGAVLAALVFLAFGGATKCGFVRFDDNDYVYENPQVAAGTTWAGARWAFTTGHAANWHPLTWLSHMADVEAYGLDPAGHHLTNVLLHAANAILLFMALRGMTGRYWPALLAAALWAVHPLRVESVAWVSERKDVLATFFGLVALGLYGRSAGKGRMAGVAAAFALSLMSKPLWVSLPFLLLLVDFWPLRRWPAVSASVLIREKGLLFLLAALSCAVTYAVQQSSGAVQPFERYPFGWRLANAAMAILQYLRAFFWPRDLACFYPHPGAGLSAAAAAGAAAAVAGLTALAFGAARRQPWWLAGWLWFLGALVPMLGLVQVGGQGWADRYTYLPHVGLIVALVWGAAHALECRGGAPGRSQRDGEPCGRSPKTDARQAGAAVLAALLILALGLASHRQTGVWRNSETLFRHALAATRNNAVAHYDLAGCLWAEGRKAEAIGHFEAAWALRPDHPDVLNNLAWALAVDPESTPAQRARALALARRVADCLREPTASTLDTLAAAQAACGDFPEAVATGLRARELALGGGDAALAERIAGRLQRYRQGQPFQE